MTLRPIDRRWGNLRVQHDKLHTDTQAIAVAPSIPNIVYFGSDGGIWKTTNASAATITWTTLNNASFSASQFMGLSLSIRRTAIS